MKKVAIYVRVSTTEQFQEGYSVPAQKERLSNYCKVKDWAVQDVYVDGGYTGSNIDRPALQRLIDNIDKFNIVLVYKLDRLSRSQKDTLYLIEDVFLSNNVDFVSMNESFDTTTPFGRAMIGILSVFAQLERETITERMNMGRLERAKEGYFHGGGQPPTGYDYIDGELVINEYEAMQVRKVFQMYLEGYGVNTIAGTMYDEGYKRKGGTWLHASAVRNVIKNEVYTGKVKFSKKLYDGRHEPIIDEETFKKVQVLRKKRTVSHKKIFKYNSLLSGFMFCGNCGARYFKRVTGKRSIFYACYSEAKACRHMIKDLSCENPRWRMEELDKYIENELFKLATDKSALDVLLDKKPAPKNDNEVIEKKISDIDKQIGKLMDLYQVGSIPVNEISIRIEKLYTEKKTLLEKLKVEELEENEFDEKIIREVFGSLPTIWNEATLDEKRRILEGLIKQITIQEDGTPIIEWIFM